MKVIAKKFYYEQDLYQYPDENTSYGLFSFNKGESYPCRREPELVYRKGEIKEFKFEVKKYCCEKMMNCVEREEIIFQDFDAFDKGKKHLFLPPGAFLNCSCWHFGIYQIYFCPYCGKKIEIEEEK